LNAAFVRFQARDLSFSQFHLAVGDVGRLRVNLYPETRVQQLYDYRWQHTIHRVDILGVATQNATYWRRVEQFHWPFETCAQQIVEYIH